MNKTYIAWLGHYSQCTFIIGETESSTHQCACPTLLIWTSLKLSWTFTTWFDFQISSSVHVLFTGMVGWLFRLYYSSQTVSALPTNKDNDNYYLVMWDFFYYFLFYLFFYFLKRRWKVSVPSVQKKKTEILSMARVCPQHFWWLAFQIQAFVRLLFSCNYLKTGLMLRTWHSTIGKISLDLLCIDRCTLSFQNIYSIGSLMSKDEWWSDTRADSYF